MSKTLDEIIEALDPEAVRAALVKQKNQVNTMIAERVVGLQTEEDNPTTSEEVKKEIRRVLTKEILGLQEVKEAIEERLADSDNILKGLTSTRASKRRISKKTSKNGVKEDAATGS